ncbi:MAG: pyridoxal-dependent decarboxylase, exosortase A system-associated [Rhodocyclaceae bacterium]|nr:pyridoxal-dependent decarboxylase, exosortase A system-associated [Rhodocyclaceae bacterium]
MDQFERRDGQLMLAGVPLDELAEQAGGTPFYAYDLGLVGERMRRLRAALPDGLKIHYAMKANPHVGVVGALVRLADGIDVASAGELAVALAAGADPTNISFAGPGKRDPELLAAVEAGVLLNVESTGELERLARATDRAARPARVALRVNPDFELKKSGMKMGGGPKPFGIDSEQVPAALRRVAELGLGFEGFHLFSGSQNLRTEAIAEAQLKCFELAIALAADAPSPVRSLNLGGGFGIPYFPGEQRLDLAPIAANLADIAATAARRLAGAELVVELGRYLVGEAGIYVTRVIDRKASRGHVFLVCDGGMHHHLAASGNFGQIVRKNYPLAIGNRMDEPPSERCSVVGPLCTPLDLLGDHVDLPRAVPGDLVVVYQSGAYGASASPQAFLSHPPAREIVVGKA